MRGERPIQAKCSRKTNIPMPYSRGLSSVQGSASFSIGKPIRRPVDKWQPRGSKKTPEKLDARQSLKTDQTVPS